MSDFYDKFSDEPGKKPQIRISRNIPGKITRRNGTKFLVTTETREIPLGLPGPDIFRREYESCLELIFGIRERKTAKLCDCGINSLKDAASVPLLKEDALSALSAIKKGFSPVKKILSSRFSMSHRLFFLLLSYFKKEELLFVDIETKSLSFETSLIQIGAGYFEKNKFVIKQFTTLEDAAEYEVIEEFKSLLPGKKAFVTFNGRAFDIPFIDGRMGYYDSYGTVDIMEIHNFDLLHFSRCAFKGKYESYRLKDLEKTVIKTEREGDIASEEVEIYYSKFLRTKNFSYLKPILYHNKEDIISLVLLTERLIQNWIR